MTEKILFTGFFSPLKSNKKRKNYSVYIPLTEKPLFGAQLGI